MRWRGAMRVAVRILAMLFWLLALLPLHGAWRLFRARSPWPRRFLGGIGRIAGARVGIRGNPLPAPVLYLANHQSWLDIMILAGATGTAFVSKAEVRAWPLFGWLASLNDTVFIARSDRGGVRQQAEALRAALVSGQPVALFPEGTTTEGLDLLPFRASLLAAVAPPPPGTRVQPVRIDYGAARDVIGWSDAPAWENVKAVLGRPGRFDMTLNFLAPVEEMTDRKRIGAAARRAIADASGSRAQSL